MIVKKVISRIGKNKEAANASWIIIGKIIQLILSFAVSIFTARYLGPNNYGLINYAAAYVTFFTAFCTLGINSILVKELISNPQDQGEIIGSTLAMRIISSLLSTLMITALVFIVDRGEATTMLVAFLCSLALVFQTFDTINYWFQARYKSKITTMVTLIAYLITSVYKIILLIFGKSVAWFAFASSVDYICVAVFLCLAYKKNGGQKIHISWKRGKYLVSQSYHYILSGMMVAIYTQTDKLMLKKMLDTTSVGYYSLASSVNNMWVFVLSAIIDSITPTIIRHHKEKNFEQYERKNRQLYALVIYCSLFVAVCFMLFGKFAITLVYGEAYTPAADTLKIICWYTMFSYLGVARNAWIVCENTQKYLKYMYFGAAVINVLLNFVMIPVWGVAGAAAASLITQICTSFILPLFIRDMRPNARLMAEAFLLKGIR